MGKNSYCSEMYAYGWVSKYFAHGEPLKPWKTERKGNDKLDTDQQEHFTWNYTAAGDIYTEEEEVIPEEYEREQPKKKTALIVVGIATGALVIFGIAIYCKAKSKSKGESDDDDSENGITLSRSEIHEFHRMYVYKNGI